MMSFRQTETASVAAAKAGFSVATAFRSEQDPRLPSHRRGNEAPKRPTLLIEILPSATPLAGLVIEFARAAGQRTAE
jgi:hypothetical protein